MATVTKFSLGDREWNRAIFRDLPGWKFDEGVWVKPSLGNVDFKLPPKDLIDPSGIPETYFKSGIGAGLDLDLEEINFENPRSSTGWTPAVRRGHYFIHNTRSYLHGTESQMLSVRDSLTSDREPRSLVYLDYLPDPEIPVVAEYLARDSDTLAIETDQSFTRVAKFTGTRQDGAERDGDVSGNTDTSLYEFKVEQNSHEPIIGKLLVLDTNVIQITSVNANLYRVVLDDFPVSWYKVRFSRPDIFVNEMTFSDFMTGLLAATLSDGDYAVGYRGSPDENRGIWIYTANPPDFWGHITYKPNYPTTITFNQDVRVSRVATFDLDPDTTRYFLPNFPVMDLTYYQDGDLAGDLVLDTTSTIVTVDGDLWTRTEDLDSAGPADEFYELDPILGTVEFGDGVNGAAADGEIIVTYSQVPLIKYDYIAARPLFDDPREDLDPLVNAQRQGFLVLDTRRLEPYRITLSSNHPTTETPGGTCCFGPIAMPASSQEDIITLIAHVTARGVNAPGVPNVLVQFFDPDGLLTFFQDISITDGEGFAYTQAIATSHFNEYVVSSEVYEEVDPAAVNRYQPDPTGAPGLNPQGYPWGASVSGAELIVPEEIDLTTDVNEIYLLITSIPATGGDMLDYAGQPLLEDEYPTPYDAARRSDGLTVVWTRTVGGAEEVIHPDTLEAVPGQTATKIVFPINLPTGKLIVAYRLVIDRTARVYATTLETDPILTSNDINICLELDDTARGQWKLPESIPASMAFQDDPVVENFDSSRISTAVYMSPNNFTVDHLEQPFGAPVVAAVVGSDIEIIGTDFPTQDELALSVFLIKLDANDEISAALKLEEVTFVSSTRITVTNLPTPPSGVLGDTYWVAVGGLHPLDINGLRQTATELTIN